MNKGFWKEAWQTIKPGMTIAATLIIVGGTAYIGAQVFDVSWEDMLALAGQ